MIKVSKEKLYQISELNAEVIGQMSEGQLQNYAEALRSASNIFPMQKEKLESTFRMMDYLPMLQWLRALKNSLSRIHADSLARDCEKQIGLNQDVDKIRHEKLGTFLDYFLANTTMLFSDVQNMLEEMAALEWSEANNKPEAQNERIKTKLLSIAELDSSKIEQMTEDQLHSYTDILNAFIEDLPAEEDGLKGAIRAKNYESVMQWLAAIEESLSQVHADALMEECRAQINQNQDFSSIRHEKLEIFVNYFLNSLAMLTDDIRLLHLPKKEAAEAIDEADAVVELVSSGLSPSAKTVLAVNKMRLFLENLKGALEGAGHRLVGATSSKGAMEYIKTAKPDLFILDADLPEIDGYELAKKIRESGSNAPIIFLTGNITKEYMVRAMAAGVADFIIKPITLKNVREKVAKHLAK
ncbi:MAG: response regulator [Defluviitaleaceae bacterium]|nr:response regulator [Defluviitaleaceae bacterium]